MKKSKLRLLLNAEPFGFGPTASIASIFPYLREKFHHIAYVGKKHTLDLQTGLAYDEIIDTSGLSEAEEEMKIKDLAGRYDILLTALDFSTAEKCQRAGLTVCIYDPLTWYWPAIPEIVKKTDLYIAQDFFGVRERLAKEASLFGQVEVVPPTVSRTVQRRSGEHVLLNLGGLQNPFWAFEDTMAYADIIIKSIKRIVPPSLPLIITTSNAVAASIKEYDILKEHDVRTCSRAAMHEIFSRSVCAFMTPGLGNIYDAAKFSLPTVWLPPANDSQGQQLDILRAQVLCDAAVDWIDITRQGIDYRSEQLSVLRGITGQTRMLIQDSEVQSVFENELRKAYGVISRQQSSATSRLLEKFGTGGAEKIAHLIYGLAEKIEHNIS